MQRFQAAAASVAANVTGLLSNATGATWALTANDCGDSLAHLITIKGDAATDHSAKTAVITGTDANGGPLAETVNLPNGTATVTSTGYFLTVDTVVPSATIGGDTMDVGWAAASISGTYSPKTQALGLGSFNVGLGCRVVTGSPTFAVQQTLDGVSWLDHAVITAKTASIHGSLAYPVAGLRLSFSVAGSVTFTAIQFGV